MRINAAKNILKIIIIFSRRLSATSKGVSCLCRDRKKREIILFINTNFIFTCYKRVLCLTIFVGPSIDNTRVLEDEEEKEDNTI
jgi:hypothetical protein